MTYEESRLVKRFSIQKDVLVKILKQIPVKNSQDNNEQDSGDLKKKSKQKKQKKMKKNITNKLRLLIMLVVSISIINNALSQAWQPTNGPFGGRVTNFTENESYIFLSEGLGIYASGIYRSADNGLSWEKVNNGLGSGQGNYTVSSLSVADNYVIAATGAGVYRSGDNGNNWVQCNYPSGNFVPNVIVFDGNTLYGGGVSGLFASDDHGLNWSARGTFPGFTYPEVPEIQSMAVTSGYVYVGTAYAGVYRSSDGGYTWEALNDGIGEPWMIEYLTFSTMVASGNDVLTGTPELGIFRLTNNGSVWVDENSGFPAGNTGTVRLMVNGQYAYIGTNIGLFKSSLSGSLNWEVANGNISVNSIRCLYGSGDVIFAGVYNDGVYRSIDESTTWQLSNEGMEGIIVRRVVKTGNNQLTATSYFGCPLFTRNNSGNSWAQGNHSVEVGPVLHNGYLFITYNMELLRSADNGSTWEVMSNAWNALPAYTLFTKGDTLFSGGGIASGIAYSTDDGASFQSVSGINNPNGGWPTVYCIENVGPNMFAGTLYGLFRSVDNGVNWNSCYPAMDHIRITDLEVKGDTVFAGTLSGVYMSTDFGLTWTTGGLSSESINTLKYHDGVLFAGTVSGGIYFTTDAGMNWTSYNQGLPTGSLNIGTIEIFNDTLYAGVFENFGLPVYARQFENSAPSQPSPIIGAQAPCIGSTQTYFVENVPGVTYNWQVPSGWTIISGSGTNQIFVLVGSTPGIVLVTPVNAFGNGSSQYLIVSPTSSAPLQPGSITGPVSPEIDTEVAYSVEPEYGVSYNWTFPEGWVQQSGGNTHMVTVLVGEASGEVAVTAATACGTSEPAVLSVTPFNPYIPLVFLVTGGGYYCEGGAGLPVGLSGSQDEIVYTLYKNGVLQSSITGDGNALSFGNLLEGTYTVMADNGTNTIWMEGSAIVEESTSILVDVTIETNQQEVCEGSSVIITAIAENGGTNPLYTWYLNGETTGVNGPEYTFTPEDSDQIYVVLTSDLGGCVVNNPATSNIISIQTIENLPVSVSIVPDANDVCAGTLVTFSASPVNGGSPNYQWYVNGEQAGTDQASFSYIPEDGDEVQVVMTSSLTCTSNNPSTSNVVTMDVNALLEAAVQVSADNNNVCAGTLVVFTATPVNGGENPEYAWQVNGVQQGGNGPTFTYTPVNGDQVNVVMTSDLPCTQENPVISNTIFMTVNEILPVSVVITADDDAVCAGTPVTLTATPQNGGTATYQWYVNTSPAGANQASFTYTPEDGDMVYVEMTSSLSCAGGNPATSNIIEITTEQEVTPSVTISASTNPVVAGEPVTFTAVPVNGGTDPEYLWFVNGFNVGTGASYTYIPADGDEVYVVMTSSLECVTVMTVVSNTIEVEVITGTEVIKDDLVKVTSYGKNVVITRSGGLKGRVEVIDLTGRLIQERTMHGEDRTEIAIESASGIYMVRVKTTEGLVNAKVLIR